MRYHRILVKLSGGAIAGDRSSGFDPAALNHIADEVLSVHGLGIQVGVVVGGGNIFKGELGEEWGIERAEADNIGMIATVINSLMLRGVLNARGDVDVRVMTAIPINAVAEPFIRLRAVRHLEHGSIVVLAGGTGNPYVTTDYPAVQRALELRAEVLLSAKNGVDGIYTADPRRDPAARRYRSIDYDTVIQKDLRALDQSAVLLARDHNLPIHVFDFDAPSAMRRICQDEDIGTVIAKGEDLLV
ncbi:MAG TPA: UMP kinase [Roseiflexaceae bacterium]|nr:UMP kinase [Roseiflexaceae bacterium]